MQQFSKQKIQFFTMPNIQEKSFFWRKIFAVKKMEYVGIYFGDKCLFPYFCSA